MTTGNSRSNKTKRIVRVSPGLLALCAALAIIFVTSFACSSSEGATAENEDSGAQNLKNKFDLSGMDAATTEAEIVRLLGEGYVMYTRLTLTRPGAFAQGGIFIDAAGCIEQMRSIPQVVCEGYPETVVEEWWESTDSSGTVNAYYGRMTTLDGVLLATGIQGEWTDVASGEEWSAGRREGRELVQDVATTFTVIERKNADRLDGIESEYLGRPSLIFPVADEYIGRPNINFNDGESEYQVANPFFQRNTSWRDYDDGTREIQNETTVLDFAMLPPGSLPEFAVMPEPVELDVPNLSEKFDLSGMDAATIEAEIIRLLGEGHVMYLRMERFGWGGAFAGVCSPPVTDFSRPKVVCESYPGRIVRETWESTDSSGVVRLSYARESKLDGTVLAIKNQGKWTAVASGETWLDGLREDRNLIEGIEGGFTKIQREYDRGLDGVKSEYLGKPSIIFGGVFEYQVANPFLWRQVRRQELGDGMRTILSEARFTDFAILPPGSFPWQQTARVPGSWTTAEGEPVPSRTITTMVGPGHCDWQSTTFMFIAMPIGSIANSGADSIQFIRDPLGVMSGIDNRFKGQLEVNAKLPADASFTGYVKNGVELWISESELDTGIFMVEGLNIEKWPRVEPEILCD